jgi:hypothetical protein
MSEDRLDPLSLLRVATNLATYAPDDAHLRAAIGRVYYALFLVARDHVRIATSRSVHERVFAALERQGLGGIGSKLGQIKHLRDVADYELLPNDPAERDWTWNWRYATRIANAALAEMEAHGLLTSAPRLIVPTGPRRAPRR